MRCDKWPKFDTDRVYEKYASRDLECRSIEVAECNFDPFFFFLYLFSFHLNSCLIEDVYIYIYMYVHAILNIDKYNFSRVSAHSDAQPRKRRKESLFSTQVQERESLKRDAYITL